MGVIIDPAAVNRILIIDDDADILRLLEKKLTGEGYEVTAVDNGLDGLVAARSHRPALVLLDLGMPVMDGFEALRELKEDPSLMDIPVIVVSSSEDSRDKVMGLELGAIDYVCKPFDFAELRARVRSSIRVHKLMRLLAQRAQIDGMTGLWNRAYFDERLASEISSSERTGEPLTLALGDFDRFKEINDTYGHPAGDAVLEGFAKLLLGELRQHDVACRFGGEEFAIILRGTTAIDAARVLERVRAGLEATVWPMHPERAVTMSFGIAEHVPGVGTAERLVAIADGALYSAKSRGRNRVVIETMPPERAAS